MSLPCAAYGSILVRAPAEPASSERFVCPACGEATDLRCNYDVGLPRVKLFAGHYANSGRIPAAKAFILLKRMLAPCEHFQPGRLEAHYARNDAVWNLGDFYAFEVERIVVESARHELAVSFSDADA